MEYIIDQIGSSALYVNPLETDGISSKANWESRISPQNISISHLIEHVIKKNGKLNHPDSSEKFKYSVQFSAPTLCKPQQKFVKLVQQSEETEYILSLKKRGYSELSDILSSNFGEPWDSIKKIEHPILDEQLIQLHKICQKNGISSEFSQIYMDFSMKLAKMACKSKAKARNPAIFNEAQQVIGQLIFLTDVSPKIARDCFSYKDELFIKNISSAFCLKMREFCRELDEIYDSHQETQLQPADLAIASILPKKIAKILMTSTGSINVGIIDNLSQIFLPAPSEPLVNYQINLSYALKLLQKSPKIRSEIGKIVKPMNPSMLSNDAIRTSLNLSLNEPITEFHAKQAVLGALLSHLRQNGDGSCFATSLAIEILSSHLGFCLKDLSKLIHESKLTRTHHNITKDIPFLRRIQDENINKKISVTINGNVVINEKKRGKIWRSPGIVAVCKLLGIDNAEKVIIEMISEKGTMVDKSDLRTIKVDDLLKYLCHYQLKGKSKSEKEIKQVIELARFCFSSQTNHPLLRIWENAIASMAEAHEGGIIKKGILQSIFYSLQLKLTQLKIPPSPSIRHCLLELQKEFFEQIELHYDPAIESMENDVSQIKESGFILYNKQERLDTPEKFASFAEEVCLKVRTRLSQMALSDAVKLDFKELFDIFLPYIKTKEFLIACLIKYHPSNRLSDHLLDNAENLPFTPWITKMGNSSKAVLEVYLESEQPLASETFYFENAEKRLAKIIQIGQGMSEKQKVAYLKNQNKLAQFRIPCHHAGSLLLGHPSLSNAWQKVGDPNHWIEEFVLRPGLGIASHQMDPVTQKNLIKNIEKELIPLFIKDDNQATFLKKIHEISDKFSIKEFRNEIIEIFMDLGSLYKREANKFCIKLDTILCQSLEPKLREGLEKSAVHFADTNWSNEGRDLHFCFLVNPGTGNLEIWECYEDGSKFFALNQKNWLFDEEWEIFQLPEALIPDDEFEDYLEK